VQGFHRANRSGEDLLSSWQKGHARLAAECRTSGKSNFCASEEICEAGLFSGPVKMAAQMCQLRLADRAWLCAGSETESDLAILAPDDIGFEKPLRRLFAISDSIRPPIPT